jgi:hypothetical protein
MRGLSHIRQERKRDIRGGKFAYVGPNWKGGLPRQRPRHTNLRLTDRHSSSASRRTAGAAGFLTLTHCLERPERFAR